MDLIVHHMFETLVVGRTEKHLSVELAAGEPVVKDFVASLVIPILTQQVRYLLHIDGIIKGRGISNLTLIGRHLRVTQYKTIYQ